MPSDASAEQTFPVVTRLERSEKDRLIELARVGDRTLSAELRRAVRYYLERNEEENHAGADA